MSEINTEGAKFFTLLTKQGANLLARAVSLNQQIKLTDMVLGDGNNNQPITPNPEREELFHTIAKFSLNKATADENNPNYIICEAVIPEEQGGWTIREVGIMAVLPDNQEILFAVGNFPETYKPKMLEGSARTQRIRVVLMVSNTATVSLKIDPSVVLATHDYVDKKAYKPTNATTEIPGIIELATEAEAQDGVDDTRALTAKTGAAAYLKTANCLAEFAVKQGDAQEVKEARNEARNEARKNLGLKSAATSDYGYGEDHVSCNKFALIMRGLRRGNGNSSGDEKLRELVEDDWNELEQHGIYLKPRDKKPKGFPFKETAPGLLLVFNGVLKANACQIYINENGKMCYRTKFQPFGWGNWYAVQTQKIS